MSSNVIVLDESSTGTSSEDEESLLTTDSGTCDEDASKSPTPKRKKRYQQAFNRHWLESSEFREWLEEDKTDSHAARCKVCNVKLLTSNRMSLVRHKDSAKHKTNVASKSNSVNLSAFFKQSSEISLSEKVANAELLIVSFMAEHHTPFSQCDHLVGMMKSAFPDSSIAKQIRLKKTKASYLMQYGIAWNEKIHINDICKVQSFSLLVDESTDVSVEQVLAVVVRYYDNETLRVVDSLLDVIEVHEATGQGLYKEVKKLLSNRNIPITNVIGFASDNCATMSGSKSGFQANLKKDAPSVFVIGCVCHSFALCANYACSKLPSWLETLIRDIVGYFSRSSKRQHAFFMLQESLGFPKHRMLKLSQTRWLSRKQVVERILEQWDPLLQFFLEESKSDKVDGSGSIYEEMKKPGTKHMLLFLNFILQKVDAMNIEFQSENFRLHQVFATIQDEYHTILSFFIKQSVLESSKLEVINPAHPHNQKALKDIYVGGRCEALLFQISLGNCEERFRQDVLSFLVELCNQIKARFPLSSSSVLAQLNALDPQVATSLTNKRKSIIPLASHFPSLINERELDELADEWNALPQSRNAFSNLVDLEPPEFWHKLKLVKDGHGKPKFKCLTKLMCNLMALPHSTACVERIFSQVNIVKTKKTNCLHATTVANRLLAKQAVTRNGRSCYSWKPSRALMDDVRSKAPHVRYCKQLVENNKADSSEEYDIFS